MSIFGTGAATSGGAPTPARSKPRIVRQHMTRAHYGELNATQSFTVIGGKLSMILHARHYATGRPIAVSIENGRIAAVSDSREAPSAYIAPAFFDPQSNGGLGVAFSSRSLAPEQVRIVANECRKHGIGAFCPTLITNSFEALQHGFATLAKAIDSDKELARRMPCFHL